MPDLALRLKSPGEIWKAADLKPHRIRSFKIRISPRR